MRSEIAEMASIGIPREGTNVNYSGCGCHTKYLQTKLA
jgi:hypothetical protein